MELRYIGGVFGGNVKPTPFLCLILKMLQIQPEKDIVVEFIRNEDFKCVDFFFFFFVQGSEFRLVLESVNKSFTMFVFISFMFCFVKYKSKIVYLLVLLQ